MVLQIEILNDNALGFLKNLEELKWIILKENDSETVNPKPSKSYIQDSENIHVLEEPKTAVYGKSRVKSIEEVDELDFTPPLHNTDLSKLIGTLKLNMTIDEIDASLKEVDESNIIPARQKTDLSKLIGAFKHKMTNDEIDSLTKSWRNEWERDFS
jgi:hypothetical protein